MTNEQKNFIDKVSKTLDKKIGEAINGANMTMIVANAVDDSFDDESGDYFRDSILKVLNNYVEITEKF